MAAQGRAEVGGLVLWKKCPVVSGRSALRAWTRGPFSDAVCIGEECFILKLEASAAAFDIIHHTVWGYFS
ncbi:hypothetical protein E2562_016918 [Oryza meyeriana var. granulata]|uniref:Uncharacterized protein n=1 Tax=Oryza meyeriana var. granulata TaxID=110450 RepID=A0A6G1DY20_9ORYZ|nr:hypothetical protein E2562_016918 [Oryza meyeriana var. granulata]